VNLRRVVLDVDKALRLPSLLDLAGSINAVTGVEVVYLAVTEIDVETMGLEIAIEGEGLDMDLLVQAIEAAGAVVHGTDELVVGQRTIEPGRRRP
jgi:hypothetical protein